MYFLVLCISQNADVGLKIHTVLLKINFTQSYLLNYKKMLRRSDIFILKLNKNYVFFIFRNVNISLLRPDCSSVNAHLLFSSHLLT